MTPQQHKLHLRHPSIVHALLANAAHGAEAPATIFLPDRPGPEVDECVGWRHDELAAAAARVAGQLKRAGVQPGDRVVVCLPTAPAFATVFLGSMMLGAIPSAVAEPSGRGLDKFAGLVEYLEPRAVVATETVLGIFGNQLEGVTLLDGELLHRDARDPNTVSAVPCLPNPGDVAFIQATSGSTGVPKGVQITHANLAANCAQLVEAAVIGDTDTWVSWLPLHHDMGLIGGFLSPLFAGVSTVLMPPSRFLRSPGDWLRAVDQFRGTHTAAPNFAYGYAAARITDAELADIDLSSWRFLVCGAEPIHPATVQRFVDRFGGWGLPADALVPGYGMAEASLVVTLARPRRPIPFDAVSRRALAESARAVDVAAGDPDALHIADCGRPVAGTEVRIVDEAENVCGDNVVGNIQFRGPSTTIGYFRMPEATAKALADGWWDTGDIGYLRDGALRVTGRRKDLIILRGANYVPSDFEVAAESVDGVRPGGVAAVGVADEKRLSEELHLIVESAVAETAHEALAREVRIAVSKCTGVVPAGVHVVGPRSIPKTTSGKLRRADARRLHIPNAAAAGGLLDRHSAIG
ncbi:fatty acyl-AMP ligase [Nocardia tengchongensis]|uniref:fatty acyl-AMP ligase n=1 Tax=Nocardia tengchongensis TaxID=2055889 RepID=UPI0036B1C984